MKQLLKITALFYLMMFSFNSQAEVKDVYSCGYSLQADKSNFRTTPNTRFSGSTYYGHFWTGLVTSKHLHPPESTQMIIKYSPNDEYLKFKIGNFDFATWLLESLINELQLTYKDLSFSKISKSLSENGDTHLALEIRGKNQLIQRVLKSARKIERVLSALELSHSQNIRIRTANMFRKQWADSFDEDIFKRLDNHYRDEFIRQLNAESKFLFLTQVFGSARLKNMYFSHPLDNNLSKRWVILTNQLIQEYRELLRSNPDSVNYSDLIQVSNNEDLTDSNAHQNHHEAAPTFSNTGNYPLYQTETSHYGISEDSDLMDALQVEGFGSLEDYLQSLETEEY